MDMKIKSDDFVFLPLGGSGEIGMNANLYHYKGKWLMVDLGISFPDETCRVWMWSCLTCGL